MIKIVIADDHAIVAGGLRQIFATTPDIVVERIVSNGTELMERLSHESFDLVVTDLSMPGVSGVELVSQVRRKYPALPVLVLSMHNEAPIVLRTLKSGASGYVAKDSEPEILIEAIRTCAAGGNYTDPNLLDRLAIETTKPEGNPLRTLSEREMQVLILFARGSGLNEIAEHFNVSPKTISTHKTRLMQKLGIAKNAELVRFAMEQGLIKA